MSLARVKELAKAGADGSIRPDELRELWALLPAVIETAERAEAPSAEEASAEAKRCYPDPIIDKPYRNAYIRGLRRETREPRTH